MSQQFSHLPHEAGAVCTEASSLSDRCDTMFQTLLKTTMDGVLVIGGAGEVLVYNDACERLFQYTPEEMFGGSALKLAAPAYRQAFDDCLRHGSQGFEMQGLRRDGSQFPIQISAGASEMNGARVVLAVLHDLTALHRERCAYDEEKAYLALISESSSDAIISYMLDGTVRSWNRAAEVMFGYKAEEIVGGRATALMTMFVPAELIAGEKQIFDRVLAGQMVAPHESVRYHRDGTPVPVLITPSPIKDASGTVVGVARTVHDLRESKAHETVRALLGLAVEAYDDLFCCVAPDGTVLTWNGGAERLLGWTAEEVVGKPTSWLLPKIMPPDIVGFEHENNARAMRGEKVGPVRTVRLHKNGSRVPVLASVSPVRDSQGKVIAIARILQDLSQRNAYEEQRALLGSIVDSSSDAIVSYALDGTITSWNRAAELMYGYSAEEMIGKNFADAMHDFMAPERVARETEIVRKVIEGEHVPPYEAERKRKDGSPLYVLVSVSPIRDFTGAIAGTSRTVRNISEAKAHEKQRALFGLAIDSSDDVFTCIGLDGIIMNWNRGAERVLGFASGEVVGRPASWIIQKIVPPELVEQEFQFSRRAAAGERIGPYKTLRICKNGEQVEVLSTVSPVHDDKGQVHAIVRTLHDLSQQNAYERQHALLSAIVESSNDAVYTKTLDGTVTSWNAAAETMFGYRSGEIVGQSMMALIPEDHVGEEKDVLRRLADGETIRHYETVRAKKDGTLIDVSVTISPIMDATDAIVGASTTIRDISERKAYEARLQANREDMIHVARVHEMSQVSAGIAHELNQPLAAMMNYSNLAKRLVEMSDPASLEKLPGVVGKLGDQVSRAAQIIRRMRDFVEKRAPHRAVEDINAIADDAVALGLIGSKAANIETHFEYDPDAPPVLADRVQIQQVLVNLLRNAAEAMAETSRRELTLSIKKAAGGFVEVSVADTGTGIPDHLAPKLFTPFVTTKENGMGIGLAISKSIVEAHGGEMSMQPNPGGGTVFRFTLPAAA